MGSQAVKVFVSYSHDDDSHKDWVRTLAEDLRGWGVDATLDQWDLRPGADAVLFMQDGVAGSDRVILVCSDPYVAKANARQGGVGFENTIVTGEMVSNVSTTKFIPVIRNNQSKAIPGYLGARIYVDFNDDAKYKERLEDLVRELHRTPRLAKPPLGQNPFAAEVAAAEAKEPASRSALLNPWFDSLRAQILPNAENFGKANMEVAFAPRIPNAPVDRNQLLEIARKSAIHTFGWPIGIVLNRDDARPRPAKYGISAEVISSGFTDRKNYDFWALTQSGAFFSILNLFEEERDPTAIFFNTRISRVTEALQYCRNIMGNLNYADGSLIDFRVRHTGLQGRILSSSNPNRDLGPSKYVCHEAVAQAEETFALPLNDDGIVELVKKLLAPMFELFDFFELSAGVYEDITRKYIAGNAT